MRPFVFAVLTLAGPVLAQDAKQEPERVKPKDPSPAAFLPLAEGNEWELRSDGKPTVLRVKAQQDGLWPVETVVDGKVVVTEYYRMDRDGIKVVKEARGGEDAAAHSEPVVKLRFPALKGTSWEQTVKTGERTFTYRNTVRGEEAVKVAAGEYAAIRTDVEFETPGKLTAKVSRWYAPGVGLVKLSVQLGKDDAWSQPMEYELVKYTVKGGK